MVEDNIVISGRVLDLEGKPFAGARVFLSYDSIYFEVRSKHKGPPKLRTTTGPDGRFSFTEPKSEFQDSFWFDAWNEPRSEATVVAQAEGFGPAWIPIGKREPATTDLTLRCAIRI